MQQKENKFDQNIPESYNLDKSKFNIYFYKSNAGREPVKDYLESLKHSKNIHDHKLLLEITTYITLLSERGCNLGMPYSKRLRGEIWELRPKNDRILYCSVEGNNIYLLHHFKKASQKTPLKELKTAFQRYKNLVNRTKR